MNTPDGAAPASVVERIRNLLALAGNNSNPNEAALAAARAAELMQKYKLEEAELRGVDEEAEGIDHLSVPGVEQTLPGWKGIVLAALTYLGVKPWYERVNTQERKGYNVRIFGRKSAVQAASYVFAYLVAEIDRLANAERRSDRAYRNAFRVGAATTIQLRLKAAAEAKIPANTTEKALAVIRKDDKELEGAWGLVRKEQHLRSGRRASASSQVGYEAGKAAGERIGIPGQERHKGLGQAPRQIGAGR